MKVYKSYQKMLRQCVYTIETTASQGINCRTIWEAQMHDPTTKELVKFLDPKDKESNKWPELKIKAMMTPTTKFVLRDGFIFRNGDKYIIRK